MHGGYKTKQWSNVIIKYGKHDNKKQNFQRQVADDATGRPGTREVHAIHRAVHSADGEEIERQRV